jgi:hypothetical protein
MALPMQVVVQKPLHIAAVGAWGAVLSLWDQAGEEIACVVVPFELPETPGGEGASAQGRMARGQRGRGRQWAGA